MTEGSPTDDGGSMCDGVRVLPDAGAVAEAAVELFVSAATKAVRRSGRFSIVWAGGSTPTAAFRTLAEPPWIDRVPWALTHVFWGDERCVPPTHTDSNYGVAADLLLRRVPVPAAQVHRIRGEDDPTAEARRYGGVVQAFAKEQGRDAIFDLVLLGLGADGHTASLFPGSEAFARALLRDPHSLVLPAWVPTLDAWRVTMSLVALESSHQVVFSATGRAKAAAVRRALAEPDALTPASHVRPRGALTWLLDSEAASP